MPRLLESKNGKHKLEIEKVELVQKIFTREEVEERLAKLVQREINTMNSLTLIRTEKVQLNEILELIDGGNK